MGDGDGCRHVGVGVNLVCMMAARRSLMRLYTNPRRPCTTYFLDILRIVFFSS